MSERNRQGGDTGETTVSLDAWVAANHPPLGSTREKVLSATARLAGRQGDVASQELRGFLNISQQLLNRHLHALESDGLIRLNDDGPGKPLRVLPTALGLRVFQRLSAAQSAEDAAPRPEQPSHRPDPTAPPIRILEARGLLGSFLGSLLARLDGRTSGIGPGELRTAVESTLNHLLPPEPQAAPVVPADPVAPVVPVAAPFVAQAVVAQPVAATFAQTQAAPVAPPRPAALGPGVFRPPQLSNEDAYEEGRLEATCHQQYRDMPWYERTKLFSDTWDRQRRSRTGTLSTFFSGFGPRWEHPNWPDFNKARRLADACGQEYAPWLTRRMDAMAQNGMRDFPPHMLPASQVHQPASGALAGLGPAVGQPAPYTFDSYDPANPEHVAHAQGVIDGLLRMAPLVFGADADGPARILTEALSRKQIPRQALDLAPDVKQRILERHRKGARGSGWWTDSTNSPPPIII